MQLRFHSDNSVVRQIARLVADVCVESQLSPMDHYLNEVSARLHGIPAHHRAEICRELRQHLESSVAAREALGDDVDTAIEAAIEQFGAPETIARRFCRAWQTTFPIEAPWISMHRALGLFGTTVALWLTLELAHVMLIDPRNPNPRTEVTVATFLEYTLPIFAGAWFVWKSPRHGTLGNVYAVAALTLLAAPFVVLQTWTGPSLGTAIDIFHVLCTILGRCLTIWLPIAIVTAFVATAVKNRRETRIVRS